MVMQLIMHNLYDCAAVDSRDRSCMIMTPTSFLTAKIHHFFFVLS